MRILALETSCDETAVAIVEDGVKTLVSVVASSKDFHEKTGGVVPEVAARKQLEFLVPVLEKAMSEFQRKSDAGNGADAACTISREQAVALVDAVAVTVGPGLFGSLVVGVEAAKALSFAWQKPLIPVNHLVGHVYANFVGNNASIEFPAVVLVVSGGHTDLVLMRDHGEFAYLGGTLDDAAGEAFDKTARLLGISQYLGGVLLSKEAAKYEAEHGEVSEAAVVRPKLPRSMINGPNFDFSFSGLKTAVRKIVETGGYSVGEVAYEFEQAVVDVLVAKTVSAAVQNNAKSILLGGGVSANSRLRERMLGAARTVSIHFPSVELCTDNAVYIASAAFFNQLVLPIEKVKANPSLGIMDSVGLERKK